jgi:hypothetical protein
MITSTNDNNILPIISDVDWPIQQYAGDIQADLASIDNVKTAQAIIGNLVKNQIAGIVISKEQELE